MTSTTQTLRDLCTIRHGGTPSKANAAFWAGDVPWVSPKDMKSALILDAADHISDDAIENSATHLVPTKSVLVVVRSGILAHTLPVAQAGRALAFNQDIKAFTPDTTKVDPDYVYWFLRARAAYTVLHGVKKGATVHSLQSGFLENLPVPSRTEEEQRTIVDLLSRAEAIVQLRREAKSKADELMVAAFFDLFGDPATNEKAWPMRKVSEFVARFDGGKNLQAGSGLDSPYRILKVSAVTSGQYLEKESKPIPDGYEAPAAHLVKVGDMLFSRANTEQLVGATAIVEQTNGTTLLPDKLWRIVWAEPVDAAYMHALFHTPFVRRELSRISSGTSASMRNISQGRLFNLTLPIAPHGQQVAFGERAALIRSVQAQQATALAKALETFDALMASLFPF